MSKETQFSLYLDLQPGIFIPNKLFKLKRLNLIAAVGWEGRILTREAEQLVIRLSYNL